MKKNILIAFLILLGNITVAGNGDNNRDAESTKRISGKVIDKKSGEEIAGAEVKINNRIFYTDLNGNFSADIHTIKTEAYISFVSYNDTKVNIDPFSYNTIIVELESK